MPKTPEEISQSGNGPEKNAWLLDQIRSPREIVRFIENSPIAIHSTHLARTVLEVRLSEDAAKQAAELEQQIAALVGIAEAQRVLAAKLDGQTDTLIGLTRALKALTLGLLILTVILCALEAFHFFESRKNPIQVAPHTQQTNEHPY